MKVRFTNQNIIHITSNNQAYNFPKPLASVGIGRGEHRYEILELYCGLDIETTNITTDDGKHLAFAYHFQVSIGTPRVLNVYLFRKWEHILHFIDAFCDFYNLGEKRHAIWADANLSFEFEFFRRRLKWDSDEWAFFAKEKRQPLKATYRGLEFREVLSISGGNLAQLAKDYCYTQKLVKIDEDGVKHSDLDYSIERNSTTPLDPATEEAYCINDVVILSEFMWYLFINYIRPDRKVPMTFTGILLNETKLELKELCNKRDDRLGLKHGFSYAEWLAYINTLQPSEEQYQTYFTYLFCGGYVHGNAPYCGLDGLKAKCRDITSDYPARINFDYVPMSPFKPEPFNESILKNKCVILHVVFDYVRTTTSHTIISKNKIVSCINGSFDNGRLISCDFCELWLTELDLEVFRLFYTYAGMTVYECLTAKRGPVPKYVTNVLNRHYKEKERLKAAGLNETPEYAIKKARCNTVFGMLCKRMRLQKTTYDNEKEWHLDPVTLKYEEEAKKLILSPFWGIYTTSHARNVLLKLVYKLTKAGVTVLYCDTDSCKYIPSHKAEQIFKHYNASMYRHRKNRKQRSEYMATLGDFDRELVDKKTGEHLTVPFKMLGAKRYCFILKDKVYATVAGMPKASIYQLGDTPEDILRKFSPAGYHLTPEESGKLTASYTDHEYEAEVQGELMHELSGVALYQIPFKLSLSKEYAAYLKHIQLIDDREEGLL